MMIFATPHARHLAPSLTCPTCALCTPGQPGHDEQATPERHVSLAMLRAATVIALRLDDDTHKTRKAILEALDRSGANHVSSDDVDEAMKSTAAAEPHMADLLAPIADMVSQTFKEAAVQTLYTLMTRHHGLTRETFGLLMEAAFALDMSPADIRGAIHELSARPRRWHGTD